MDTFLALVLLTIVGFVVVTAGLVTIDNKVSKIWKSIDEFYEINKELAEINDTLISIAEEENKTSLDICEHIRDVITLNTELIRIANDSLNSLKEKH